MLDQASDGLPVRRPVRLVRVAGLVAPGVQGRCNLLARLADEGPQRQPEAGEVLAAVGAVGVGIRGSLRTGGCSGGEGVEPAVGDPYSSPGLGRRRGLWSTARVDAARGGAALLRPRERGGGEFGSLAARSRSGSARTTATCAARRQARFVQEAYGGHPALLRSKVRGGGFRCRDCPCRVIAVVVLLRSPRHRGLRVAIRKRAQDAGIRTAKRPKRLGGR